MTFLQNLWRDLVDKHLWPVALLLVLAAVAVPFLIDTGSSDPVTAVAAPAATEAPPVTAQIAVAVAEGEKPVARAGKARDPFKPLVFDRAAKAVAAATATAAGTASGTAGAAAPAAAPSTSKSSGASAAAPKASPSTPSTPTTTPTTTTTTKLYEYELTVAIERSGRRSVKRGLRAVSYLPSSDYVLLSYLGVKEDRKTATFLVTDGTDVLGKDRSCRPSPDDCRILELQAGDTVKLERTPPGGGPVKNYRFSVRSITLEEQPGVKPGATAKASSRPTSADPRSAPQVDLVPTRTTRATLTTG